MLLELAREENSIEIGAVNYTENKNILTLRDIMYSLISSKYFRILRNSPCIFNKPEPHVEKEEAEIAMISMPDTVANKHAMMLPL